MAKKPVQRGRLVRVDLDQKAGEGGRRWAGKRGPSSTWATKGIRRLSERFSLKGLRRGVRRRGMVGTILVGHGNSYKGVPKGSRRAGQKEDECHRVDLAG